MRGCEFHPLPKTNHNAFITVSLRADAAQHYKSKNKKKVALLSPVSERRIGRAYIVAQFTFAYANIFFSFRGSAL